MPGRVLDLLTPKPFRGDVIAAGVMVLVVAAGLWELRGADDLDPIIRFVVLLPLWAFVMTLAWRSPVEGTGPRAYQSLLHVAALILAFLALAALAMAISGDGWLDGDGSRFWVLALITMHAIVLARVRNSAVCTLLAAVGTGGVLVSLLLAVSDETPLRAIRWLLLALAAAYTLNAVRLHTPRNEHGRAFAEAAGLVLVGLAVTWNGVLFPLPDGGAFAVEGLEGSATEPGAAWTLVMLAAGFGLVGYGGVERERGPIWIGALLLLHFSMLELDGGLLWWPLLLLAVAATLLWAGLRPSVPAPPPPDADRPVAEPLRFPRSP